MPVYDPNIGGGGKQQNMQSNPSGKEPSQHFNTYDPNRDTVRPFMSDMDSHGGGGFAYLNTDQPPPLDYAHIPNQTQQGGQPKQMHTHMGPNGQPMFTASQPEDQKNYLKINIKHIYKVVPKIHIYQHNKCHKCNNHFNSYILKLM